MSRRKKKQKEEVSTRPINNRAGTFGTLGGLALAAFFISWWITNCANQPTAPSAIAKTTPAAVTPAAEVEPEAKSAPVQNAAAGSYRPLEGKWSRTDGGYVIEIRSVDPSGKMDAAYFNPRPINVSSAQASREGDRLKVEIELRDKNYPGSLYHLTYDPGSNSLAGTYFQAAEQRQFEVEFTRMK